MEAKTKAREEYLAILLLMKSDPKRYGTLVTDVENTYTRGQNGYPTTVSGAYDMLVNYKNPNHALRMQNDRIPSTTPGAEPPRDAKDSGSARSHSMHLETSSSNRP